MKRIILDSNKIVQNHIKDVLKELPFALLLFYPGEEMLWDEINYVAGKNMTPEESFDNQIIILSFNTLDEVKDSFNKCIEKDIHSKVTVYKKGKQITW